MRTQNTPRTTKHESYWLTQGEANLIGCLPVWHLSRKLLNAYSKYGGSRSILSNGRLEQRNRPT
jgi:hypothetical protein